MKFLVLSLALILVGFTNNNTTTGAAGIPQLIQVNSHLYRGGRPDSGGMNYLAQQKVKTDLDIENDNVAIKAEQQQAKKLGITFVSNPMGWTKQPSDQQVQSILKMLQDPANYPIFLHCKHGEDRTGLIMGLYRVQVDKWTPAAAYKEMLDVGFHPTLTALDDYFRKVTGYTGN